MRKGISDQGLKRLSAAVRKNGWNPANPHWDPSKEPSKEQWKEIDEGRRKNAPPEPGEGKGHLSQGSTIRLESGDFGWDFLIVNEDTGEDILIQTDWDYPGVATTFGWPGHEHDSTDGTIDCPECGKSAMEMINEAREWLSDHIGDVAEDPGYFGGDE